MAVGLNDPALLARFVNGQLRGTFGAFREVHDLTAQFAITRLLADIGDRLRDIGLLYLAPWRSRRRR